MSEQTKSRAQNINRLIVISFLITGKLLIGCLQQSDPARVLKAGKIPIITVLQNQNLMLKKLELDSLGNYFLYQIDNMPYITDTLCADSGQVQPQIYQDLFETAVDQAEILEDPPDSLFLIYRREGAVFTKLGVLDSLTLAHIPGLPHPGICPFQN